MDKTTDENIYFRKGQSKAAGGNFKGAVVDYSRAIRLNKNHLLSLHKKGGAFLEQEKYKEALLLFRKVVMLMPKHSFAYYNLALVLDLLGKTDESVEMYKEAIRLDPSNSDGHLNLAILLTARERYEEAQEHYLEVLELKPSESSLVSNGFGYVYFAQGILTKAKEEFEKSISLDGKLTYAYCNMSLVLFCEKKSEEALKYFEDGMKPFEGEENKRRIIKVITMNYTDHKTRLEAKLNNTNDEIVNDEEQRALFKIMIDGLVRMIGLLTQELKK